MRTISKRGVGLRDDTKVSRCTCGAWMFKGIPCGTCRVMSA